ncbi:uncharacterized protein [Antedon mediterranea]|uniref:uncharacterized protein n=1 Tax=Antedon mediterranea TaxID=105859 RepID=UPI003AF581C9
MRSFACLCFAIVSLSTFGNAMDCDKLKEYVPNPYKCPVSGECIFSEWVCDTKVDCVDKSDEGVDQCADDWKNSCKNDFIGDPFQCNNGMCISASKSCDGVSDCLDGSDEINCSEDSFSSFLSSSSS